MTHDLNATPESHEDEADAWSEAWAGGFAREPNISLDPRRDDSPAADPLTDVTAFANQLQGQPTPPVNRCCPVCDRPYHTDEDECPKCRKQFASSIAPPVDELLAEVEKWDSRYDDSRKPGFLDLIDCLATALREARERIEGYEAMKEGVQVRIADLEAQLAEAHRDTRREMEQVQREILRRNSAEDALADAHAEGHVMTDPKSLNSTQLLIAREEAEKVLHEDEVNPKGWLRHEMAVVILRLLDMVEMPNEQREWMAADLGPPQQPTLPPNRCCPVCDRPYHTDEDECPKCRKQFASSIAPPMDELLAEVEKWDALYDDSRKPDFLDLIDRLATALREAQKQVAEGDKRIAALEVQIATWRAEEIHNCPKGEWEQRIRANAREEAAASLEAYVDSQRGIRMESSRSTHSSHEGHTEGGPDDRSYVQDAPAVPKRSPGA